MFYFGLRSSPEYLASLDALREEAAPAALVSVIGGFAFLHALHPAVRSLTLIDTDPESTAALAPGRPPDPERALAARPGLPALGRPRAPRAASRRARRPGRPHRPARAPGARAAAAAAGPVRADLRRHDHRRRVGRRAHRPGPRAVHRRRPDARQASAGASARATCAATPAWRRCRTCCAASRWPSAAARARISTCAPCRRPAPRPQCWPATAKVRCSRCTTWCSPAPPATTSRCAT